MSRRRLFARVLLAAILACAPVRGGASAQSLGLRGSDSIGGFPTSPSEAPLTSPERLASPSIDAPPADSSPAGADTQSPSSLPAQNEPDDTSPNYGKPRPKRPKLYRPAPKLYRPQRETTVPLSPLAPYQGSPGTKRPRNQQNQPNPQGQPAANDPDAAPLQPGPTVAALPVPLRLRRPQPELDPYAPIGIRSGQFVLKPFVEASTGYESNPNQVATGVKASPVLRTDAGLDVASDFSNHSLTASLRGGYSDFPANSLANRPDFTGLVNGRLDVTRNDTIDSEARFTLATQTPGSPLLAIPNSVYIVDRPLITSEGATLGGTHIFGRFSLGLKGTFDRTEYGDARQSDGTTYRYSLENYNDYGTVVRAAYEVTPAVIPFAEVGVDDRIHDSLYDISGYERDSIGGFARAGFTFDFLGHFTGTASGGYLERHYEDPRLPILKGPSIDARLIYTMTPLTTITLGATTVASETTLAGASGAISRSYSAEIAHVLFRNFTVSGIAVYQPNTYQGVKGSERYTTLTLKGAYSLSREVQLIASASHQHLSSTFIGEAFTDEVFLAGIRLQR